MGAEYGAGWSLDSEQHGFEKMESGFNARAIDFARFGLIFLHGGFWNGLQILPAIWVAESTSPLRPDPRTWEIFADWKEQGGTYSYHWWGLDQPDSGHDFMALGQYGQMIYVAPRKNAVIVRMGDEVDPAVSWPHVAQALIHALL